jgi:hypothetical protein
MRAWGIPAAALVVVLSGCRSAGDTAPVQGIEAYGLSESAVDHPTVEPAIRMANLVLGPSSAATFAPGWKTPSSASAVRVVAAAPEGLGETEVMTSYHQCNCVIVQVGRMSAWLSQQTGTGEALLAIDIRNLIAYMLLHEMGHVKLGDVVGDEISSGETSQAERFNLNPTTQKEHEVAADLYAAKAIAAAEQEKGTDRGVAAARIDVTLAQLAWNLAEHRLIDNFGGTALHRPSLFYDVGLSHPNLEWRILSVSAAISDSPTSRKLLSDFESSREPQSTVLYRAAPR